MPQDWDRIIEHAGDVLGRKGVTDSELYVCGHCGVPGRAFRDDTLEIVEWTERGMIEIVRVENRNPVIMTGVDGAYLRYHGEFGLIEKYFFGL